MNRRVVVTGIGCVTPLGNDVKTTWDNLCECRSGMGPITHFDATNFPTKFAAEVKDYDLSKYCDDPSRFEHAGRNIRFAIGAAHQAMTDSGILDSNIPPEKIGVYLGAGEGQQNFKLFMSLIAHSYKDGEVDFHNFASEGLERLHTQEEVEQEPNMTSAHLASLHDLQGPNLNCLTACAASSQAIGEATEIIRRGEADAMLSGGAHSMIHAFGVTGFNLLTALSTNNENPQQASRPFDKNRDGFVLGEGAGMLVLEELERAKARGATIYGEVAGYGSSADAYRITDIQPQGVGAIACIEMAMEDAGVNPEQIGYVNAHGTSTKVNDRVETLAVKHTFGNSASDTAISSIKSSMGHLIGAAGSVEAIACLMAMRHNVLPPTLNYETPDPELDLDYIPNAPREKKVTHALSNSFGFGGQNISLVLAEYN